MKSPITHSRNTRKVDSISVEDIVESYRDIDINNHVKEYFSEMDKIDIYECRDTGYRFYYPYTIFGDNKFYSYLQTKRKYYADWRWEYGIAYDQINSGQKVLEIGCGVGNFLNKVMSDKNVDCSGLEFNKSAIEEARKKGLNVFNQSIEQHSKEFQGEYDVVCFFHVLEHAWDPKGFLEGAIACLKKGGKLIVSVPNNNPYYYQHSKVHALNNPPHHAGLWDKKSLYNLSKFFEVELFYLKAEPLFNEDHFWGVKINHWRENNKTAYLLGSIVSGGARKIRNYFLRSFCDGCNILAMYNKR